MWILKSGRISIHLIRSVSPPVPNQWIGSEHPYCIRVYSNLSLILPSHCYALTTVSQSHINETPHMYEHIYWSLYLIGILTACRQFNAIHCPLI